MQLWSSVSTFVSNRRRTLTWVAGTLGGAYVLGQWGLRKLEDMAERSKRDRVDADNLARRFDLNQQDCQFTIIALLPQVAPQLLTAMDVERSSAQLAQLAAQVKARERALSTAAQLERQRVEDEEKAAEDPAEIAVAPLPSPPVAQALNPAAAAFVPSFGKHEVVGPEKTVDQVQPNRHVVPNGDAGATEEHAETPADATAAPHDDSVLSKSWAEVVQTGNGQAAEVERAQLEPVPELPTVQEPPPAPEPTRAELWNEIKILSFTRTLTALYLLSLLSLQTHIQLSLLGRSAYIASVLAVLPASGSTPSLQESEDDLERALYALHRQDDTITENVEQMYLTFSWWLLHRGWVAIGERVRSAVEEVVGPLPLKSTIVYGELPTLLGQIRTRIDLNPDGTPFDFTSTLFPPTSADELLTLSSGGFPASTTIPPPLRRLLDETRELAESPDGSLVRQRILDALFFKLVEKLEGPFRPKSEQVEQGSRFEDVTERTVRLAGLLPTVARQSHLALTGLPNEYAEATEDVRELAEFSAIIYASFDQNDVRKNC